jgi:hypothetical protein
MYQIISKSVETPAETRKMLLLAIGMTSVYDDLIKGSDL